MTANYLYKLYRYKYIARERWNESELSSINKQYILRIQSSFKYKKISSRI